MKIIMWEYKVVRIDNSFDSKYATERLNEFGANGWEFCGKINCDVAKLGHPISHLMFKRPCGYVSSEVNS